MFATGLAAGYALGSGTGMAVGMAVGATYAAEEIAKRLLAENIPLDLISRVTKLPLAKIQKLQAKQP